MTSASMTPEIKIQETIMNKGKYEFDDQDKAYDKAQDEFLDSMLNIHQETKLSNLIESGVINIERIQQRFLKENLSGSGQEEVINNK